MGSDGVGLDMSKLWVTKFAIYQKDGAISFSNGFCVSDSLKNAEKASFEAICNDYKGLRVDTLETSPIPQDLIEYVIEAQRLGLYK